MKMMMVVGKDDDNGYADNEDDDCENDDNEYDDC